MKKLKTLGIALALGLMLSSCGVGYAILENQNQNSTQVHLRDNNYRIVEKVTGSAEVEYIFLIGGMKKRQLYENAYSNMIKAADLTGSRALVNLFTEEHIAGFAPFYNRRTITVHAHVIEFTD